jgi:hypothetical protein
MQINLYRQNVKKEKKKMYKYIIQLVVSPICYNIKTSSLVTIIKNHQEREAAADFRS